MRSVDVVMRSVDVMKQTSVWGFMAATTASFAVYLYTLCPTVYAGDSGELSLACLEYGIPHPPGYPVFVLLGHVGCMVAGGGAAPAAATNATSALLAALATGCIFLLLHRVLGSAVVALAGAWLAAFGATFWGQATITEVYPSVCLGFCCLLLAVEGFERTGRRSLLYLLAYLSGLALTLHQSMVLVVPAAAAVCVAHSRHIRAWKWLLLFFLGLSPYLLVMVRSMSDPYLDWGDPETPARLAAQLLRVNYGDLQQNAFSLGIMAGQLQAFFARLLVEIPLPVLLLAPVGLGAMQKTRPVLNRFMAVAFLSLVFGLILIIHPSLDSVHLYQMSFFYLPVYALFAVWCAVGFHALCGWLARVAAGARNGRFVRLRHALVACSLLAPAGVAALNAQANNRRDFFDARTYGENLFRSVPAGATLVTDGDNETFILAYLQRAEGMRPDVRLAHRRGFVFDAPGYLRRSPRRDLGRNASRWQRELLGRAAPVFYATYTDLGAASPGWSLEREGLVFRAVRASSGSGRSEALLASYDISVLRREPRSMEFIVRKFAIGYLGAMWDVRGRAAGTGGDLLADIGEMGYEFAEAQFFVGTELEKAGDLDGALQAYAASARLDPDAPMPWHAIARVVAASASRE